MKLRNTTWALPALSFLLPFFLLGGRAQASVDTPPVAVSVTPGPAINAVGAPELLTATYSSAAGASNLSSVALNIGNLSSPATSLYAKYVTSSQLFFVANASGTYTGGYAAGTANTITTALGTLNLSGTTVTQNGNQLVIGWDFTPTASLFGIKNLYLLASDNYGLNSGWQNLGVWSIGSAPSVNSPSVLVGPSGTQHANFGVTLSPAPPAAESFSYATANGTAIAGTDYTATSGTLTIPAGSTSGTISVPVAGGQADASGLTFTLSLSNPLSPAQPLATGTATIIHDAAPVAVSVTPNPASSAFGAAQLLTTTVSSVGGVSNLSGIGLNIGKLSAPATSLYGKYVASSQLFYLANAAGTYIGGYAAGSSNTITTSLGTLNLAGTTVSQNGNQLIIGWDFTPTASLIGSQNLYLLASDNFGLSSGWQNLGTWTVGSQSSASINSVAVVAGPSGTQHAVFTVTVSPTPAAPVTLSFATANGTASAGSDYTVTSGTLTIPAGTGTGTISVPVAGGQTDASGLTFTVTLSNPVNVSIGAPTGTATIIHEAAPVAVGVTPNPASSPANAPELLTATYSSVGGASNFSAVALNIGKLTTPASSLYAKYVVSSQLFYVANASGSYIGGYAAGSADTITTALGTLNLAATTVTQSGNQLVVGWNFTPASSLVGSQNIYLLASDNFGMSSGWENLAAWTILANPVNDDFANAIALSGVTGSVSGTTVNATAESGEAGQLPVPPTEAQTVWYAYTAPSGVGALQITEQFSGITAITVYTGSSLSNLSMVDNSSGTVNFNTSSGTTYYLQIGTYQGLTGPPTAFTFGWKWSAAPANDDFANAQAISGASGTINATTEGATVESGEPHLDEPDSTVWYAFTAPGGATGNAAFNMSSNPGDYLGVYTGTAVGALTEIGSYGTSNSFATASGTTYYIQVACYEEWAGPFTLNWTWTPANDNFANAQVLAGVSGSANGTTVGATVQSGESGGGAGSVWYSFTTPSAAAGALSLSLGNPSVSQTVTVFSGTNLTSLIALASGTDSVQYGTSSISTFAIQVTAASGSAGNFILNWTWAPVNDDFVNATVLTGASGSANGTTIGATVESGEPGTASNTVWYGYSAPGGASGRFSLTLSNDSPTQSVAVYTGNAVSALTAASTAYGQFLAPAGATCFIQVSNSGGSPADFTLAWSWVAAPANDDFAYAQPLSGTTGTVNGTTVGATVEPGESYTGGAYNYSVWYTYTGPAGSPGAVDFWADGNPLSMRAYSGTALSNLTSLDWEGGNCYFPTSPGSTYYIQVLDFIDEGGSSFTLQWNWYAQPANDDFANAQAISGASGTVAGNNQGASIEPGEPTPNYADLSVWYAYTAPSSSSGTATISVSNNTPVEYLAVFTGTSLTNLTQLPGGDFSTTFATTPGTTYYVQVSNSFGLWSGPFDLNWTWTASGGTSGLAGPSHAIPEPPSAWRPSSHSS